MAAAADGAGAMRASGAFAQVIELKAGGLLLRATGTPREYDEADARGVFEVLRPVLPPGKPRPTEFETFQHIVMENAAA